MGVGKGSGGDFYLGDHFSLWLNGHGQHSYHLGVFLPGDKFSESTPAFRAGSPQGLHYFMLQKCKCPQTRKEQGEQNESEEDLGLVVNMTKWLIPLD